MRTILTQVSSKNGMTTFRSTIGTFYARNEDFEWFSCNHKAMPDEPIQVALINQTIRNLEVNIIFGD